jgi:oligopeptide/dipeptide ABC transporter ATP-binding protein
MKNLLEVHSLKKYYPVEKGLFFSGAQSVKAVDGVSFHIEKGETLGLVGESACGKTTVGRTLLRLVEPTMGKVFFDGEDIFSMPKERLRELRKKMQIIFQDPYSSLNPRFTVRKIVGEAMVVHKLATGRELKEKVEAILERVGLSPKYANRYPHEFSGGQRQRIGIARAIALNPSFIVCDEAVSALDVSIQAQILNLLQQLQEEMGLSYLFISHDLYVVEHISKRIAVMYLGKIVEIASSEDLMRDPAHPYTRALLSANPSPDPDAKKTRIILEGDVPSPLNPPSGCHFHTRCPNVMPVCRKEEPQEKNLASDRKVWCFLYK